MLLIIRLAYESDRTYYTTMTNKHLRRLYDQANARYSTDSSAMTNADWLRENTTLNKKPFSFDRYPFQEAIVNDMHPNLSCIKCSQVGLTEIQIRKFLAVLRRNVALKSIFTLPNEKMFKRVSTTRIRPILDNDIAFTLQGEEKSVRNRELVQIGHSWGYLTGCTEGDATSIDADILFHDEVDLSPQAMLALFQSRLQNSDWKVTQSFSTPTFVDYGIDSTYKLSDMREYFIKCSHCNAWEIPEFTPEFIKVPGLSPDVNELTKLEPEEIIALDVMEAEVVCKHCRKPYDLADASLREWVARKPEITAFRGYKVRPFSASRIAPSYMFTQLAKYKQKDFERGFHNTVMGDPYTNENARISLDLIRRAFTGQSDLPDIDASAPVYLGADIGQIIHLTLGTPTPEGLHVFWFETLSEKNYISRVKEIMDKYNVVQGANDRYPYEPLVNDVRDMTDRVIMPAEYTRSDNIKFREDEEGVESHVQCNRTKAIDVVASAFRKRQIYLSGYGAVKDVLEKQLRNMVRNEEPEQEAKWVKLDEDDHFFHSLAYLFLAYRMLPIRGLKGNQEFRTAVYAASVTYANDKLLKSKKYLDNNLNRV